MMLMLVFIMFTILTRLHAGASRRALTPWT